MKTEYVLGFLKYADHVVMVKKEKPKFMAGFWNGIGGSIEINETPAHAMTREAEEEANLNVDWNFFAIVHRPKALIYCFWAECDGYLVIPARNDVGEQQGWIHNTGHYNLFESVPMLLELAKLKPKVCDIYLGEPK